MIKLIQGFDVCSPLPIDGRILLSKKEMYEIDDNIMPEKYFAICKEDGRLYLYNKYNVITEDIGKFRLADNTTDERITREVATLNNRIDNEVETLNERVADEVTTLNSRIDEEVSELNSTINTKEQDLQAEDYRLNAKIDNYKADKDLVDNSELITKLLNYSLGDEAGTQVVLSMDTTDYVLKLQLFNRDGQEVSVSEVNTPLEEMVIDADYDEENEKIILHLKSGHDVEIPIGALISDLVSKTVFNDHVNNTSVHIQPGERDKWDSVSREAVRKGEDLFEQFVEETPNVTIRLNGGKIEVNATDTKYYAGEGISIDAGNKISTYASAPRWEKISEGYPDDSPLDNRGFKELYDSTKLELETAISNEESARVSAVSDEASLRAQGDEALSGRINDVSSNVSSLEEELNTVASNLSEEESRAISAEASLNSAISAEITRASQEESRLEGLIDTLKTGDIKNLKDKDVELEASINTETDERTTADQGLSERITSEETSRTNEDVNINQRIDNNITRIEAIESKIPTAASSDNQLADKDFVNSSIASNTATFRGTVETKEALKELTGDVNDYAFLKVIDDVTGLVKQYDRYKYSETVDPETGNWAFEYTLNNSSFTSEQWAAINSSATAELIAQITTNKNSIESLSENKVDKVNGKSLIDNVEIERLTNIISGANKVTPSINPGDGNINVQSRVNGTDGSVESINVYTLTDEKITNVQPYVFNEGLSSEVVDGKTHVSLKKSAYITVEDADWEEISPESGEGFGFKAVKEIEGITSNSEPIISVNMQNVTNPDDIHALDTAFSLVYKAETYDEILDSEGQVISGVLILYAYEKPNIASGLSIVVKGY